MRGGSNGSDLSSGNAPIEPAVGSLDEIVASNGSDRYVCNREGIVLPKGAFLLLRGWAANRGGNGPAAGFELLLDRERVDVRYGEPRVDVAQVYGLDAMRDTGFRAVVQTATLAPGSHEIRLRVHDAEVSEFEPIVFTVGDASQTTTLRSSEAGLFEVEIDRFHCAGHPPSRAARIERRFIAVVGGTLRTRAGGAPAATLLGLLDDFDAGRGQLGLGPRGDRFLFCFPTNDMPLGIHELTLVATSTDERLERIASVAFSIVPICCGPAVPLDCPEVADANVDWIVGEKTDTVAFARDDVGFVRGWALDPIGHDAAGKIFLEFEDGRMLAMRARQAREDVARIRSPRALFCGFVGSIPISTFGAGSYVGRVVVESKDLTRRHRSETTIAFDVRD